MGSKHHDWGQSDHPQPSVKKTLTRNTKSEFDRHYPDVRRLECWPSKLDVLDRFLPSEKNFIIELSYK